MINNLLQHFFQNSFDARGAIYFQSLQSDTGITIFKIITWLGDWRLLLLLTLVIIYVLLVKRQNKFIIPLIVAVAGSGLITFFIKIWFHRLRPSLAIVREMDFSFPSGHATAALAAYGFLAFILISVYGRKPKALIIISAALIIILIGLSRLYLNVHYISDVLAGYLIGLIGLIAGIWITKK